MSGPLTSLEASNISGIGPHAERGSFRNEGKLSDTGTSTKSMTHSTKEAAVDDDYKGDTDGDEIVRFEQERGVGSSYISGKTAKIDSPAEEVGHLRAAMNAQIALSQQRGRLAKYLSGKDGRGRNEDPTQADDKVEVLPKHNDAATSSSPDIISTSSVLTSTETTSTESGKTVRGGATTATSAARTPSYSFPPMRLPRQLSSRSHQPFTSLSPTVPPEYFSRGPQNTPLDRWVSGLAPSASVNTFQLREQHQTTEDPTFPSPKLYDLSVMLLSEPGLDLWWATVVQIMRDIYKADRVTLAVPADPTDIENVPWGQMATFTATGDDQMSVTYLRRGSLGNEIPLSSASGTNVADELSLVCLGSHQPMRPRLQRWHSYTVYEDTKRSSASHSKTSQAIGSRSPPLSSKSHFPGVPELIPDTRAPQTVEPNLQPLKQHIAFDDDATSAGDDTADNPKVAVETRGRIFPVLQALDYEADPLIDSTGVARILDRGKLIALTRDYPYMQEPPADAAREGRSPHRSDKSKGTSGTRSKKPKAPESVTSISSALGGASQAPRRASRSSRSQAGDNLKGGSQIPPRHDHVPPLLSPKYEEYEQVLPLPWSQSPTPSPAIRAEQRENSFFATAEVNEESFNPKPQDYTRTQDIEAIGIDQSHTLLHVPLYHPVLSNSVQSFRLGTAAMESRTAQRSSKSSQPHMDMSRTQRESDQERRIPVAILSIRSPVLPYPSNLRDSLEHLAPHLATSFSLSQHYSSLETEIAGLQRKRLHMSGFGAVVPARGQSSSTNFAYFSSEDELWQESGGGVTSPSDRSGASPGNAGLPSATPGWDPITNAFAIEGYPTGRSPDYLTSTNEGYFNPSVLPERVETGSGASTSRKHRLSKDLSPSNTRYSRRADLDEQSIREEAGFGGDHCEANDVSKIKVEIIRNDHSATVAQSKQIRNVHLSRDGTSESSDAQDANPSWVVADTTLSARGQVIRRASTQQTARIEHPHTRLHTGGVDFGTTFPSLPSRTAAAAVPVEMLPPSDRLKTLMLDALPAQIFVALSVTGEMVWVNNRYLAYRGQTVAQLYEDPWGSIHPDERDDYLKAWGDSISTGRPFSKQVRIRRFDGAYRWFFTRAVAGKDTKNVIVHWYGSHMDIHDQHVAEVKAARQEEIEASEANYRLLANLIPQIIFAASEEKGVIFANEQWLSYTGQEYKDALGFGFLDFVHPEDLAKCRIPLGPPSPAMQGGNARQQDRHASQGSSDSKSSLITSSSSMDVSETPIQNHAQDDESPLSWTNNSSGESKQDLSTADLAALAGSGGVQVTTDSDGRRSCSTEVRLRSKDGEYRWHLVRCVEVDNFKFGDGGDGSWFGACTDINDHKFLEAKLKEAMDSKSRFLSNMSHEIRTPLIGISGMVSFLQDTDLNEEQLDYAHTIQTSANSLLSIINDILDLSKFDAGMMKLSFEWLDSRSVIEEVNELLSTMAISKGLELSYVVDEDVPAKVKGDKIRIRQVLLNVIGNAIKFTSEGEVFSTCKVYHGKSVELGENEIMLEFSIVDTGQGFTKEEAQHIFKPFSQIDGSSTRQYGGSGLGLAISRQLVELHGGKMEGSAIPGNGSTFTFTAKFGLPTTIDCPEPPSILMVGKTPSAQSSNSSVVSTRALESAGGDLVISHELKASPSEISPKTASLTSSASSDRSIRLAPTYINANSSPSSTQPSLARSSEAARASGHDLLNMKLALSEQDSTGTTSPHELITSRTGSGSSESSDLKRFRPPMFSILIVCPQNHSREATTKHIEHTLPKGVPYQITPLVSVVEAQKMIGGDDPVIFTHVVLNFGCTEDIVTLMNQILHSASLSQTLVVILSDPVQRQAVIKVAVNDHSDQLALDNRVTFVYKPVKPSRLAVVFDPDKERGLSTDRNRSSAQQQVASQKQNYLDAEARLGKKGHKVLLAEDNLVNQKVLLKFLSKVGINVEIASDGVECTDKVFSMPHDHYSLILCDLHMPRKDGYQACRDIRTWEKRNKYNLMPIIALSANVMASVRDKCVKAGFSSYITKPVDFKQLGSEMANLLDKDVPQHATRSRSSS